MAVLPTTTASAIASGVASHLDTHLDCHAVQRADHDLAQLGLLVGTLSMACAMRAMTSSPNEICGFIRPREANTRPVPKSTRYAASLVVPRSTARPSTDCPSASNCISSAVAQQGQARPLVLGEADRAADVARPDRATPDAVRVPVAEHRSNARHRRACHPGPAPASGLHGTLSPSPPRPALRGSRPEVAASPSANEPECVP